MASKEWSAETKQRAENAMEDLEAFYDDFCNLTPFGRRPEMPKLEQLHARVMGACDADGYVLQKLTSLTGHCKRLAVQRPPLDFDESEACRQGLSCVSSIRAQLHVHGFVERYDRPRQ
ncbi:MULTISPECIES: hypothetical protein [unclassified Acidovorax]|uniref:hypothetical protein n=1 Tax=unclassified Acidovorax TaxID=2684926 RepID=UPI001C44DB84|nr:MULTISPECIES: hypothetical protein [unclassified Acidovorax]MBV7428050.1 hypothetical protein [Acidovorax sp. sif0732]MBV7449307.1 hypothetical protein [Acidovorax sp. sif0715]